MIRPFAAVALASLLVACVDDGAAPEGARLLLPSPARITWNDGFNGINDGLGVLVPIDLMVYEGRTGEPLEMVDIRFAALSPDAEILAAADVELARDACVRCVWDAGRDRYLTWRSGSSTARTDEDGLARVYVWVDAFPERDGQPIPIEIAAAVSLEGGAATRRSRGSFQIVAD